ncbi:MAG: CheR family methyltransferase [Alphaproteobacteria bacterium]
MTPQEFDFIVRLVRKECGLVLSADKGYLVESRLTPVARRLGCGSADQFVREMMKETRADRVREVVEAMVTNETFFFRDRKPFDQFREFILPGLLAARANRRQIRVWCAACSTGQEPYSIAMLLKEAAAQLSGWRIEILATDISTEVLRMAKDGVYSQFEVQRGLPIQLLVKYFTQQGDKWQLKPDIRSMVTFRPFNLLSDPGQLGSFDVVFCRNVLIYFDPETKTRILDGIARVLAADGHLYLGGAETVLGISSRFHPVPSQRGLYALADPAMRAAG